MATSLAPVVPPSAPDLDSYDHILVAFSGGKDSVACVLHLLDLGVNPARIELWHHDIDGREGGALMDWPITRDYCRAFAAAFGLRLFYSWKVGGFEREMLRENARTAAVRFEQPDGSVGEVGGTLGTLSTRRRFPQVAASLTTRWCSSYLKIQVMATAICNQPRFARRRTLVITGERAEESAQRARYAAFEPHRSDRRQSPTLARHIDHWRPILRWPEAEVWAAMARYRVNPHPAYRAGFGRVSCAACIFGSRDQWATLERGAPAQFARVAAYEDEFGVTIRRAESVRAAAAVGTPYPASTPETMACAQAEHFAEPIIMPPGAWTLPAGAMGEGSGPP